MKIGIIGTGAYSLAHAIALSKSKKNKIKMWTEDLTKIEEYNSTKRLNKVLKDQILPTNLTILNDFNEVVNDAELVFIGVSAPYLKQTITNLAPFLKPDQTIVIATKGIEDKTGMFLSDIVKEATKSKRIAVISGPSFAVDVASGEPIGLSGASKNKSTFEVISKAYKGSNIKFRFTTDIIGVQICGSVKNVIALASGMLSGMGYSNSTQSFLITESLHDIKGLINALGGSKKTILSFAGVGDLLLTCTSVKSRNFSFGEIVGKKSTKKEIEEYLKNTTVEGYYTLNSIKKLIKKKKIKMPIVDLIYNIIVNGKDPESLAEFLFKKE